LSISFSLIYNATKIFHLAHAGVIIFAAYAFYGFSALLQLSFFISFLFAVVAAMCIGVFCEVMVYKKMRMRTGGSYISYMVASIGLYVIMQNMISFFWGDEPRIISNINLMKSFFFLGAYITGIQLLLVALLVCIFFCVSIFLKYTVTGKSIRAVSSNYELCNNFGIDSDKVTLVVFIIGSALAAFVGILYSIDTSLTPSFGFNLMLYGVVAMIIGGVGSTRGLLAGSFLVATAQHLAAFYLDTKWMDAVTYIILILFLIWKPLGFSGNRLKKVEV
jgi:branched-chain amino acid transport system permease protein